MSFEVTTTRSEYVSKDTGPPDRLQSIYSYDTMQIPQRALPTIIFGAFDRHNLGDMLFSHVTASLLKLNGETLLVAGLAERDMGSFGGYQTRSVTRLAEEFGKQPLNIIHAGGELLTCDAWQAAVMLQPREKVQSLIRQLEAGTEEVRERWIHQVLGVSGQAPYTVPRELFPGLVKLIYLAVGGVELSEREETYRSEVVAKLQEADYVSVRDQQTWAYLNQCGIKAYLVPDPAVLVAELFGEQIEQCSQLGEVAAIQAAFPHGYITFQFSADFGDDATLVQMAQQLEQFTEANGLGVVLFRAGAAPWHDDIECYWRLAGFMNSTHVKVFNSLNIWDICALIARGRLFCGSSLHGRVVAMAFGLPRVNLRHPHQESRTGKQAAYAATWELPGILHAVDMDGIAAGVCHALTADQDQLLIHSQALAARYLTEFSTVLALLDGKSAGRS